MAGSIANLVQLINNDNDKNGIMDVLWNMLRSEAVQTEVAHKLNRQADLDVSLSMLVIAASVIAGLSNVDLESSIDRDLPIVAAMLIRSI
jgi:hypothetical protein